MKDNIPRFVACPLAVCVACFLLARLIAMAEGPTCGHGPGSTVYTVFAVVGGALLAATPWLFQPTRPLSFKLAFALAFMALGAVAWFAALLTSGMFMVCVW